MFDPGDEISCNLPCTNIIVLFMEAPCAPTVCQGIKPCNLI
jgi:hypothetical protein